MSVFKRGKKWQYDFWVDGKRYRGSIQEARVKAQAERAEIKIRDSVYEGRYGTNIEAPKLCDFITETYLPWAKANKRSWVHDEFRSRPLIEELGNKCLNEISMIQVEGYKQQWLKSVTRLGTPRSPSTVNRELELLSGIFQLAIDSGIVVPNPCRKVRRLDEDNQRSRYLSDEEEDGLISKLTGRRAHLLPLVRLALLTLMRKNELLQLRWANVDFTREVIHVMNSRRERTKSKRSRIIPMSPEVKQILLALYRQGNDSEYVFTNSATGNRYVDVKKAFASACDKAKIKDFWFHDLRRTGATRLGEAGVDAFYIATLLGHADVHTSQIYTFATNEGLRRAMNSLAAREKRTDAKVPTVEEQRPRLAAVSL